MSYKITIEEVKREIVKENNYRKMGVDERGEDQYGYVQEEKERDVSREVYTQLVEGDLDLKAVIDAVNK